MGRTGCHDLLIIGRSGSPKKNGHPSAQCDETENHRKSLIPIIKKKIL